MPELKRVRLEESGHEVTVASVGDGMKVLDKPATDTSGRPLAPKYHTTVDKAAASKSATSKEDSK